MYEGDVRLQRLLASEGMVADITAELGLGRATVVEIVLAERSAQTVGAETPRTRLDGTCESFSREDEL